MFPVLILDRRLIEFFNRYFVSYISILSVLTWVAISTLSGYAEDFRCGDLIFLRQSFQFLSCLRHDPELELGECTLARFR